jgi:hypothetical protein
MKNNSRIKLVRLIEKIIREERMRLQEIEVTDPELKNKMDEFAELIRKLTEVNAAVDKFKESIGFDDVKKSYEELAKSDPVMWEFFMQLAQTKESVIRTKKNIIEVKRASSEVVTFDYKSAFISSLTKVNSATKKILEDQLEATKTISKRIGAYSSVPMESRLREASLLGKIASWASGLIKRFLPNIKRNNTILKNNVDEMTKIVNRIKK